MNGGNGEWWLAVVKLVGVPGAVAAYFMLRDWWYVSESVKLQGQIVELLRLLVNK